MAEAAGDRAATGLADRSGPVAGGRRKGSMNLRKPPVLSEEAKARRNANLKPFKKGSSGNQAANRKTTATCCAPRANARWKRSRH
jgi:hypothetical protein